MGARSLYLAVIAALALAGCSSEPDHAAAPKPQTAFIAIVGPCAGHPQAAGILGGATRHLGQFGMVRGECVSPRDTGPAALLATVRHLLERKPAAICLYVTDHDTAEQSIQRILTQQVLLVTMGARYEDARIYGHVTVDLPEAAELLATHLKDIAATGRTYVLVHANGRSAVATRVYQRFLGTVQEKYGREDMRLLRQLPDPDPLKARYDSRSPAKLVESLLELFPNASLVVTLDPEVWLVARAGWDQRMHALNADFRFATLSTAPILWPRLGTAEHPGDAAGLVGPVDGDIGYTAVALAVRGLYTRENSPVEQAVRCEVVTPATLPDFARRYSEAANGLDVSEFLPSDATTSAPARER